MFFSTRVLWLSLCGASILLAQGWEQPLEKPGRTLGPVISGQERSKESKRFETTSAILQPAEMQPLPAETQPRPLNSPSSQQTISPPPGIAAMTPERYKESISLSVPSRPARTPAAVHSLNLHNASLAEVIDQLARMLKINYILDPRVKGGVYLNTYGDVKGIDARSLLDIVLRINGFGMVEIGDLSRIVPLSDLGHLPLAVNSSGSSKEIPTDDEPMLNLVFLKYATADELAKVLTEFTGEGARITTYAPANLLFILDSHRSMRRTMDLISTFDSDLLTNQRVRLFETHNGRPSDIAQELSTILKNVALSEKPAPIRFLAVDRINTIIAVAPNPGVFEIVESWLKKLDVPVKSSNGVMDTYVYRVKYERAVCLGIALMQLYGSFYGGGYGGGMAMAGYGGMGYGMTPGYTNGSTGFGGGAASGAANAGQGGTDGCGGISGMTGVGAGYGGPAMYGRGWVVTALIRPVGTQVRILAITLRNTLPQTPSLRQPARPYQQALRTPWAPPTT